MDRLSIQMLGSFTITYNDQRISDQDNRSRKVWALIAYFIFHRKRTIPQDELIDLLWTEDQQNNNPAGALKAMIHRARNTLDALWEGAGKDLILHQGAGYTWNRSYPCDVDIDLFELLCKPAADGHHDYAQDVEALRVYRGTFLPNMSAETWVIPVAAYYHNCYIQRLLETLPIMLQNEHYNDVATLCQAAIAVEPFQEEIYCYFMRALLAMGDRTGAVRIYQKLRESLFSNFCILPSEETRALYHEATKTINDHTVEIDTLQQQLKEEFHTGALICEYDFFRILYHSMERSMARSGMAAHIAVLTVTGKHGAELSRRQQETAVTNLEEHIRLGLRRGDAAARCSISQFVIMLPQANYENSIMVCNRLIRSFFKKYTRSDIDIKFNVCPILPEM